MARKIRALLTVSFAIVALVPGDVPAQTVGTTLKLPAIVSVQQDTTGEAILIRGVNLPAEMPTVTLGAARAPSVHVEYH